jgi:hypothetical protein
MKNIKIDCSWDLNFDFYHEQQLELYVDTVPHTPIPENTIRFVFLLEPPEIYNQSNNALIGLGNNTYNYLLTHNQELLDKSNKAHLFEFGTTWVKDYDFPEKNFSISALIGGKLMAQGHYLRQELLNNDTRIQTPKNFFISSHFPSKNEKGYPFLEPDKKPLFNSQFHICIENAKRLNWFTEKLIDTLTTKTIPIYWGCPNIGDWFNLDGFYIVDNVNDIVNVCNSLDETVYNSKLAAIEENYQKALFFSKIENRLIQKMTEIINLK